MTKVPPEVLGEHPFLQNLSPEHLRTLAAWSRELEFGRGELLFREGGPATGLYLVRSGRVSVELHTPDRGPAPVQTVGPGEAVGWSWLIPPHRLRFDGRALEPTRVILIDGEPLRAACESDPELGFHLLRRLVGMLAGRLEAARLQILDMFRRR